MAKRKAAVNDIIYELDNEDIEISSDDEVKEPKINRLESVSSGNKTPNESDNNVDDIVEVIDVDNSPEDVCDTASPSTIHNGGKPSNDLDNGDTQKGTSSQETEDETDSARKINTDLSKTTIFNEDIVIDSPCNSDLEVVGCENRKPLVTVRFRDSKMANSYKEQVKAFMLNLIKLHEGESLGSDNETDLELDIWPEDLNEAELSQSTAETQEESNLFFVDTDPCADQPSEVPRYSKASTLISNVPDKEPTPPPARRGPCCFNCDGSHQLRDCTLPRDYARIAEKRKAMNSTRVGRYHVEDEQKYGHLIPGRISGQLRHALGLKRNELPLHIYRMRLLGYPPGWLEEARISHSGISMFDSTGNAILEPEEEEGEVCEPGSKDKFDIKKILDFPGFNVPASSRYVEESQLFGLPPISEQDSKMAMLQFLAPNAMKAYKRKKLTFFPSASTNNTLEGSQAEMELDSGDEIAEFPSNPPLPDEAPPPPPPPPTLPPPPIEKPPPLPLEKPPPPSLEKPLPPPIEKPPPPTESPPTPSKMPPPPEDLPQSPAKVDDKPECSDDIEVIEVIKVGDIPVPLEDMIVIDEDDDKSQSNGRGSPSLDDLEEKKRLLLTALESDGTPNASVISVLDSTEETMGDTTADDDDDNTETIDEVQPSTQEDSQEEIVRSDAESTDIKTIEDTDTQTTIESQTDERSTQESVSEASEPCSSTVEIIDKEIKRKDSLSDNPGTPESKPGHVKDTAYGTPVMNIASSYVKLPTDVKFAKDICDVINFENLPNSTGKYKKISALLRKVKSEVDRIQDS